MPAGLIETARLERPIAVAAERCLLLMQPVLMAWQHPGAACYKRDWHLESLSFSLNFRLARRNSPRVSPTKSVVRASWRVATGVEQNYGTNGRYRIDRSGSHGPEPDDEYERPDG